MQKTKTKTVQKSGIVKIGRGKPYNQASYAIVELLQKGKVVLLARGTYVSKAFDTLEIVKRRFDGKIATNIESSSQPLQLKNGKIIYKTVVKITMRLK